VVDALVLIGLFILGIFIVDAAMRWRRNSQWRRRR
jgi:hypothetical protein